MSKRKKKSDLDNSYDPVREGHRSAPYPDLGAEARLARDEQPFIGMNIGEVHEEPEAPDTKADDMHSTMADDTPVRAATAVSEPIHLQGPFTVAGGNVLDAGGNVLALCGFSHNRVASGPAVAGAVMTALNKFYRHPVEVERDKP